jgi:DNA-binding transcriptional MerR regulator/methylmalonyl-CoA mutase cobalamin-binding subunit
MSSDDHLFNLKAVVRQTGIKPDTLRAWERRYGLPEPARSSGGHRLYSQHDIDTLNWLVARQHEGLSIKRAVEQWRQVEAEGHDPLQMVTAFAPQTIAAPSPYAAGETLKQMQEDWLHACLSYDEQQAALILNQAFALYPPEAVAVEVLQRAAARVGEGWYEGDVTVQQEHFCSALIVRRLEALVMSAPPPSRPGRILVACPPEEYHIISPLLRTFLLRRRGWQVLYLGANVPTEQLETTVTAAKPHLVIIAAQRLHTAANLVEAAQLLRQERVPLAYGGLIFNLLPALRRRVAGHFLGEALEAAPRAVESLMTAPHPVPVAEETPAAYRQALDRFEERRALIEAQLIRELDGGSLAHQHLAVANQQIGLNIGAALALGDIHFLGTDLEWVRGLLRNYQIPDGAMSAYLHAYLQAATEQLGKDDPVVGWLGELVGGAVGEKQPIAL